MTAAEKAHVEALEAEVMRLRAAVGPLATLENRRQAQAALEQECERRQAGRDDHQRWRRQYYGQRVDLGLPTVELAPARAA